MKNKETKEAQHKMTFTVLLQIKRSKILGTKERKKCHKDKKHTAQVLRLFKIEFLPLAIMFNKIVIVQRTGNFVVKCNFELWRARPINCLLFLLLRSAEVNLPPVLCQHRLNCLCARLINRLHDGKLESPTTLRCECEPDDNPQKDVDD
jgi:hypothetical protein